MFSNGFSNMDFLHGKTILYKAKESVSADVALKKKSLILYYFTNNNCENCRIFDMQLKSVYETAVQRRVDMAVIVISFDSDKETHQNNLTSNYYEWYALQYNDELSQILMYNYGVTHVPTLVVVRRNGDIVTREGKSDVEKLGINVLVTWSE